MTLEVTFKQVCDFLKKDGKKDPKLIEAIDNLLGVALICSPIFLGPVAIAALPTLAVKNELVKMGKFVFTKLAKKDSDYVARQERMQIAYGLLCFTSFFEALDRQIPPCLRDRIGLLKEEKEFLAKSAVEIVAKEKKESSKTCPPADTLNPASSLALFFPHPTESVVEQVGRHAALWKQMGEGFHDFLHKLAFWDDAKQEERAQIRAAIAEIPDEAARCFEAQYCELACTFEEFAIWANLQEHKKGQALLGQLSGYFHQYAALAKAGGASIDIGFVRLHETVLNIPESLKTKQAAELVESLTLHYNARLNEPIIDKEEPQEGRPGLSFPLVCDAFIPQSYRFLRHTAKAKSLEDEATWENLPRRNDLGVFMLGYLSSPYSTESPLLVLGHPGSGKSLLTTVLSAQLMSKQYTAIRVPLREVNAEAGIVSQIEETVRRITHISVDSWAKLSSAFRNNPPLVILDGYDELLQASGKVFSGYLKEVQTFQKNEAEQGRPVRVIVTSRVTLIDKATIPSGATILRLLEFDKQQRDRWISIWNRVNVNYFREAGIEEFALPDEREEGAQKVLALAEQPLLLLMLALYDSERNDLRKSKALDRTKLYDSLLRRFVTRERGKEKGFDDTKAPERKKILDTEMHRLGVAALAMYNRRKVHILSTELNEDLKFFDAERTVTVASGKALSQADLLLGSFFFVHKSKAQHASGASEHHEEAAFEFLHNTFGEFLTADFILRRSLAEVEALKALNESEVLRAQLEQRLGAADGFQREWFASLVYTPLFTRPVVLQMIREWIGHVLKERNLPKETFISYLDTVVLNQVKRLLNKREMPSIIRKETAQEGYRAPFGDYPLLGHIAIYSMNLILLRVIVADEAFVFDEMGIGVHEDGARPWDRLTHIWRSWFALDNLNGVTAVMLANRKESEIRVRAKERFQVAEGQNRLEVCLNVALSLGDDITSGLAGLVLFAPSKENTVELDDISQKLHSEKIDLELQIAVKRLIASQELRDEEDIANFWQAARRALEMALRTERFEELELIGLSIRNGVRRLWRGWGRRSISSGNIVSAFRDVVSPRLVCELGARSPAAALLLFEAAKDIGDREWQHEFRHRFAEFGFGRHHGMEFMERNPGAMLAWIQLLREVGSEGLARRIYPEMIERTLHPRYFLQLSERNPQAALAYLQLVRERGTEEFLGRLGAEVFESLFNPGYLQQLSRRAPEVALAWLQLGREAGGERFLERLDPAFLESLFHPRYLLELNRQNPEAALAWVQMAREVGGENFLKRLGPEVIERIFRDRDLLELSEWNPEAALVLVQVAREIGGENLLRGIEPSFFERAFHPRHLLELGERSPKAALASVELAREVGAKGALRRLEPEFFEGAFHPRHLSKLSERNPEIALAWVNLALDLAGKSFLEKMEPDFYQRAFTPSVLDRFLRRNPQAFAVALRLARAFEPPHAKEMIANCLISTLENRGSAFLGDLPLRTTDDLKWLAAETDHSGLRAALVSFVGNGRVRESSVQSRKEANG